MTAAVQIVGGVDPHTDTVHVAILTSAGKVIGDAEFPTTAAGCRAGSVSLPVAVRWSGLGWRASPATVPESPRALQAAGISVVEVERPTRSARRRAGKSDQIDAYHAARAVLAELTSLVKDAALDGLRALHLARRSAVKARTAAGNQMKAILIMAPEPVAPNSGPSAPSSWSLHYCGAAASTPILSPQTPL